MCFPDPRCTISIESEYEARETHVIIKFEPQLLYPPRDEATNDCYYGQNGEMDGCFQCDMLLTRS